MYLIFQCYLLFHQICHQFLCSQRPTLLCPSLVSSPRPALLFTLVFTCLDYFATAVILCSTQQNQRFPSLPVFHASHHIPPSPPQLSIPSQILDW